jgi:hypothetical protein
MHAEVTVNLWGILGLVAIGWSCLAAYALGARAGRGPGTGEEA